MDLGILKIVNWGSLHLLIFLLPEISVLARALPGPSCWRCLWLSAGENLPRAMVVRFWVLPVGLLCDCAL